MASLSLEQLLQNTEKYLELAQIWAVFVYPTDTIYGLGAIVTSENIQKIDRLKQREPGKYYSIMAPSFEWIDTYFDLPGNAEQIWHDHKKLNPDRWLTLVLKMKDSSPQDDTTDRLRLVNSLQTVGVRYINHPFQKFVELLGHPFITTSCNFAQQNAITEVSELPVEMSNWVDVIVDGWKLDGQPSIVIDLTSEKIIRS